MDDRTSNPPSIEMHYDEVIGAMCFEVHGVVGVTELVEILPRFLTHPEFRSDMGQLLDLTEGGLDVTADDLSDLLKAWKHQSGALGEGMRLAVATSRPVDFGQSRMYQALLDDRSDDFRVFTALEPARAWLRERRTDEPVTSSGAIL